MQLVCLSFCGLLLAVGSTNEGSAMNWQRILATALLLANTVGAWFWWRQDEPRRAALGTLAQFHAALDSSIDRQALLDCVSLPSVIAATTPVEQADFLCKVLDEELSAAGLRLLEQQGHFGPLQKLFPFAAASGLGRRVSNPRIVSPFAWSGIRSRQK